VKRIERNLCAEGESKMAERSDGDRDRKGIDTTGWKEICLEFGSVILRILAPPSTTELTMGHAQILPDPQGAMEEALSNPIGSPSLSAIIRQKDKPPAEISVAIAVSDITRPVPYKGAGGILDPLLKQLQANGIRKENLKIIVATGMHRPSSTKEKLDMYGEEIVKGFSILDHDCQDRDSLVSMGKNRRGTDIYVNRDFYFSDLKIATGLVESHFMAGISGGRKTICPGLVDVKTIQRFHGPAYLEDSHATNLILEGNPCHEEALEVARAVGVDFLVNVTLDKDLRLTQVFAGDLEEAHRKAYEMIRTYAEIPLEREFDIVLTHGGYVGRDHYQTAKAGVGALPAVKAGGTLIIAANNREVSEPVGSPEYRTLIHLLKLQGAGGYLDFLRNPHWRFTKDQWEPEVWARVLRKVGEEGLIYCSPQISREDYSLLPGRSGLDFLRAKEAMPSLELAQEMVQSALFSAVGHHRTRTGGIEPTVAFIREGPYAVPLLRD
jgi:lactate racemase